MRGHTHEIKKTLGSNLSWEIVGAEGKMVPPKKGRGLCAHKHLKVLEKVNILLVCEGHEDAQGPGHCCVHKHIAAARSKSCLLQSQNSLPYEVRGHDLTLAGRTIQQPAVPHCSRDTRVVVHIVRHVRRKANKSNAAKAVSNSDSAVV